MKKYLLVFTFMAFAISCSSSGGGGSSVPPTKSISGKVSDPAVKEARVVLVDDSGVIVNKCGAYGGAICQSWTNEAGVYSIPLPVSADVSSYSLKTYGGTDTVYGKNFDNLSFSTVALSNFTDHSNIIITPLTSLQKELFAIVKDINTANDVIKTALGISQDKILLDPETDISLLRHAYMIVKVAMSKGGDNPFKDIATSLNTNKKGLNDDAVLSSIFGSEETTINEIKNSYVGVMAATDVNSINNVEFKNMFISSYANLLQLTDVTLTENIKASFGALSNFIKSIMANVNMPLDSFIINKVTSYIASYDATLRESTKFDVDLKTFQSSLSSIFSIDDYEKLSATLVKIISEKVNDVKVGTSPLGNDNQKRLEYYFNSNLDVNYMARSLISRVNNDNVRDSIYNYIISTYAKYNLLDRAKTLADVYVKGTLNRISAYLRIANGALLNKNNEKANELLDYAYNTLEILRNSGYTIDSGFISSYISLASYYANAGNQEKYKSVMKLVLDNLIAASPKPSNTYASLLSSYGSYSSAGSLLRIEVDNQRFASAFNLLPEFVTMIGNYYRDYYDTGATTGSNMNTTGNLVIMYYSSVLLFYSDIAFYGDDTLKAQAVTEAEKVYDKIIEVYNRLKSQNYHNAANLQSQFVNSAAASINLFGYEKGKVLLDYITTADRKADVASRIVYSVAKTEGFEEARKLYEQIAPIDSTYSNVVSDGKSLVSAFVVYGAQNQGLAYKAYEAKEYELVRQGLDYAYDKLKLAAKYQLEQDTPDGSNFIGSTYRTNTYLKYHTGWGNRYLRSGYTAIAYYYYKIGDTAKAKEVLQAGYDFNNNSKFTNTFLKYTNLASLAYNAKITENTDLFNTWYQETKAFKLDGSNQGTAYSLDFFRALDAIYMQVGDYKNVAKSYLESALTKFKNLYQTTTSTKMDNLYSAAVTGFTDMATAYNLMNDTVNAKKVLIEAETPLNNILAANTKKTATENILKKYGEFRLAEDGYNKSQTLLTTTSDRHEGVKEIAEALTSSTVDNTSGLAISDIDKDGKPDFYVPYASQQELSIRNVVLDDDIDGDGKLDTDDTTPFFAD